MITSYASWLNGCHKESVLPVALTEEEARLNLPEENAGITWHRDGESPCVLCNKRCAAIAIRHHTEECTK
jgi:hypothetical protein